MKFKGKKLEGKNNDLLVLTKGEVFIAFKAEALMNYKEFDKYYPAPEPPMKLLPGGIKQPNERAKSYLDNMDKYAEARVNYMMLKSLVEIVCYTKEDKSDLEVMEWETVDIKDPGTYDNWQTELESSGFSEMERMRIMQLCVRVNALDDALLDNAKESFLAEARQQDQ